MDFKWDKYKLTTKIIFDSPIEYILILKDKEKILISYKSSIKIFNIKTLKEEGEMTFPNIQKFENLYLLKSGLISICTSKCIFLIELHNDNTYKIFQKIEFPDNTENNNFMNLIELKNNNLCIISTQIIFIYKLDKNNNYYKKEFILKEEFFSFELAKNQCCIELIYLEKNIENKIAVFLYNVSKLSFWDLNERKKINDTKNNYCNNYDLNDIFCLMEKGKYLLCACIDEAIKFYSTETCTHIKSLHDCYWHLSILKISENHILSGGDFGNISLYEFNYENELFKKEQIHLSKEDTENIEKIIDIERPEKTEEKEDYYGHGKLINEIRKFGETIISTSCYEENNRSFVCFWNKE